jgi:hypothetical protein
MASHHQSANGHQCFVAEAVEKVGCADGAKRAGKGKELETDNQDHEDEQAGRFERNFLAREKKQRQQSQQQDRQGVDVWNFGKDHQAPSRRVSHAGIPIIVNKNAVSAELFQPWPYRNPNRSPMPQWLAIRSARPRDGTGSP